MSDNPIPAGNNPIVYAFTQGEGAVLLRLQTEVMRAITLYLSAHNLTFDPSRHIVDWSAMCVVDTAAQQGGDK